MTRLIVNFGNTWVDPHEVVALQFIPGYRDTDLILRSGQRVTLSGVTPEQFFDATTPPSDVAETPAPVTSRNFRDWVSPNGVTHLVGPSGACVTCGGSHE